MYTKVMMLSAVLVGIALFNTIEAMPNPGVHHTQGQKVTHVHKFQDGNQQGGGGGGTVVSSTENTVTNIVDSTVTNVGGAATNLVDGGVATNVVNTGGVTHVVHTHTNTQTGAGTGGNTKTVVTNSVAVDSGSHDIKMGVRKNTRCKSGLIDETATNLQQALNGGVAGLDNVIHQVGGDWLGGIGKALDTLGEGASELLHHAVNGVESAIDTAACGLGDIADTAANGLDNGDILGAVDDIGSIFFGGLASMGEDVLSSAANGLESGVSGITGALGELLG